MGESLREPEAAPRADAKAVALNWRFLAILGEF